MNLLDQYNALRAEVFAYFGYVEDWHVMPLDDSRRYFWKLESEGPSIVKFANTEDELANEGGQYYENEIYRHDSLQKGVYRGADYTMVVVDTHTDGNQFLQVFTNANERP